jgi:hypothetical protein
MRTTAVRLVFASVLVSRPQMSAKPSCPWRFSHTTSVSVPPDATAGA